MWVAESLEKRQKRDALAAQGKYAVAVRPRKTRSHKLDKVGLAAVDAGVADVLALDDVDDVFGDVGGVVADTFEIFGDEDELEGGEDDAGIAHHVGEELSEDLVAVMVDLIVGGENFLGEVNVAADDGVEGIANHFLGQLAHARKIDVRLDARMTEDTRGGLRDVDGLVADALEVIVDARDSEDEAEVDSHQLMKGKELDDAVVDFNLELVDGVFFVEDALRKLLIGFEDGVHRLMDGALGEAAHPEEALFQFVQISFEVAFHELYPLSSLQPQVWKSGFLASLGMTNP
jgi:hypothetical protein